MLYIWPYITFFSFPLLLPHFVSLVTQVPFFRSLSKNRLMRVWSIDRIPTRPRLLVAIPVITTMSAIVRFNTIVHPFTLADNRHYTFYVFRLLLRHPMIKYIVTPIYFICAWAAIQALGGLPHTSRNAKEKAKRGRKPQVVNGRNTNDQSVQQDQGQRVSFVLIFLLTTTFSVVTAPLVEPRYFIIPWCIWRLNVPFSKAATEARLSTRRFLALETIWYLAINFGTGYMFLYRPFTWPSEPGRLQRFMW